MFFCFLCLGLGQRKPRRELLNEWLEEKRKKEEVQRKKRKERFYTGGVRLSQWKSLEEVKQNGFAGLELFSNCAN